ncbi:GTPase [Nocardiopsis sp. NPDC049922]|uniref:YfjP family GTPase n=1 Tax=Nocardiopsis sp. NPDC049922 TaxID=3155157 RepID=UPI00340144A7
MTTQWNPTRSTGETGSAEPGDEVRPTGGSEDRSDDPAQRGAAGSDGSGPWRGYTVPVPEHSDHTPSHGAGTGVGEAAHDGIAGYPDAVPAEEAPAAPRRPAGRHARVSGIREGDGGVPQERGADAPRGDRDTGADPESIAARGRRDHGDHGDHDSQPGVDGAQDLLAPAEPDDAREEAAPSGRGVRGMRGTRVERGRRGVRGVRRGVAETRASRDADDAGDDPDGLAGWVGSLAEAAEDAQIAGRNTGAFPAVASNPPEWVPAPGQDGEATEQDHGADEEAAEAPSAASPAGAAPADAERAAVDRGDPEPQAAEQEDGGPLPRRVPGPSAVSGAFRAVGADATAPESGAEPTANAADASERPESQATDAEDDDEYRPTVHDHWQPTTTVTRAELIERLDALSTLTELGQEDLPEEVVARSAQLLDHAGARLRLSAEHTVVALAGGTGSGKSSLFNALCGLELSQTGVTRPTTSKAHACVWGHEGADALLSWLGVPTRYRHSRTGVLDAGNSELTGLVLLDLPDHDSVRSMHTAEADRLIGSVDLLVWVLDPQKYADAAVHHRYLARMAGHGAVTVAVLNQVDRVEPDELEELLTDLRRLMETESGVHPRVITTSTVTGQGIRDLRAFLGEAVRERRALVDRLVADLDQVVVAFEEFHGEGGIPGSVPGPVAERVRGGLASAAGVRAVADVTETNDAKRGKREVGWPVARLLGRVRKDPLSAVQLDFLRDDGDAGAGGPVDAHVAELETVLGEAADGVSEGMPAPWRRRMRAAALSGVSELPAELGEAVSGAVGASERAAPWWKVARSAQYALLAAAGLGLAWALVALVSWLAGGLTGLAMFDAPVFVAYSGALAVASLLVGWLTGVGCGNLVEVAAVQRRERVERAAGERVAEIARQRVVEPMEAELDRYRAFRAAYEVARAAS